ncbi:Scarecrow-like protein 6 [Zea mays]|uniref:Scarecrow-like protein 6 n=1 Tax=Zea mays TaxID=4577 RepID=A0A3L6GET0_MAIZE|nr:Scarecrow-like protein 6 [Zea mays]PWZ45705.1 Scarecrow-like protein 6 [Zea mays]
MRAAPFSADGKGAGTIEALLWPNGKGGGGGDLLLEPTSVLDCRRSPSPRYSSSTLSSSLGGAAGDSSSGVAAVSENSAAAAAEATKWAAPGEHRGGGEGGGGGGSRKEWSGGELPPIPGTLDIGFGAEEGWDAMLGDAAAVVGQDQTFLNWIMTAPGDMEPPALALLGNAAGFEFPASDPIGFSLQHHPTGGGTSVGALASDLSSPSARSLTSSSGSSTPATSPAPAEAPPLYARKPVPPPKPTPGRRPPQGLRFPPLHTTAPFQLQPSLQPPRGSMKTTPAAQQHQQLLDELAAAAKAAEVGNSIGGREILARLNQQLPPIGKPFLRSASYLKEALLLALTDGHQGSTHLSSPLDVALKLGAYKSFSDLSPVLQFANFTATQALLDEIASTTSSCIHIIDFDLGVGGQWASFAGVCTPPWNWERPPANVEAHSLRLKCFPPSP